MFAICSYPDGTPILIAGPCWPFCALVTGKAHINLCLNVRLVFALVLTFFFSAVPLILGVSFLIAWFLIYDSDKFDLVRVVSLPCSRFLERSMTNSFCSFAAGLDALRVWRCHRFCHGEPLLCVVQRPRSNGTCG